MNNSTAQRIITVTGDEFWPPVSIPYGAVILATMHAITMSVSLPGNLLIILAIITHRTLKEQNAYLLIASVCCADILVSLSAQPLNIYSILYGVSKTSKELHLILFFCVWGFCGASAFGVINVTLDRFIYIIYPLHYEIMLTHTRTLILVLIQWSCGLAYGGLPIIDIIKTSLPTSIASLVTLILMTIIMVYIYQKVYEDIRRIGNVDQRRPQNQVNKTIFLIVIVFSFCWFPYITINFLKSTQQFRDNQLFAAVYYWSLGLGCWNSCFNVFIYGLKNTTLRNKVKKMILSRCYTKSQQLDHRKQNSINIANILRKIWLFWTL